MTEVNLSTVSTALGAPTPVLSGVVEATYWAGWAPFTNVVDETVTFPHPIVVAIVDGDPVSVVDMVPTGGVCCVRWVVRSYDNGSSLIRFTSIPDTGPVDFGDLPVVDPASFTPVVPTPTLVETIDQRIELYLSENPGVTPEQLEAAIEAYFVEHPIEGDFVTQAELEAALEGIELTPGPPGADGADGADGKSAYEVAVDAGFVGDVVAWLASLVGEDGVDGEDGAPGAPGAPGADGADGPSAVSADAGNLLTLGSDSLIMLDPDDLPEGGGAVGPEVVKSVIVETGTESRPAGADVVIWIDPDELGAADALATDPVIVPGGDAGSVPPGGDTGQVLSKASGADFDTEWVDQSAGGGGGTGEVQFVVARSSGSTSLTTASWVTYPLDGTPSVNNGGGSWNSGTYIYTVPKDGLYLCLGAVRTVDDNPGINLAVGIGVANSDGPHVLWGPHAGSHPANRSGRQYTRIVRFEAGDQVRLYIYVDGSAFSTQGDAHGQYMSIVKLAD